MIAKMAGASATWGVACIIFAATGHEIEILGVKLAGAGSVRVRASFGGFGFAFIALSLIGWIYLERTRDEEARSQGTGVVPHAQETGSLRPKLDLSSLDLFQLPRDIDDFTGREGVVTQLEELLSGTGEKLPSTAVVIAAVGGAGGVGKTALAVHVAHRVRACFPDGQLYVNLRGVEAQVLDPTDVLSNFLLSLGIEPDAVPDGLEERARRYRAILASRRVLVVLDNARDEKQVRHLLPGSGSSAALITSRARLTTLEGTEQLDLTVLEEDHAVELLGKITGKARVAQEREAAEKIVRLCGYLPLAVRIAGAKLAAKPHWDLELLVERLSDERRRLEEFKIGDLEVRASFALSYDGLGNEEKRMFKLLGSLQTSDFPAWLGAALADIEVPDALDLIERLVDAQLIEALGRDTNGEVRYRFHDLLRVFARECLRTEEPAEVEQVALNRGLRAYLDLAREGFFMIRPGDPPEFPDWKPTPWGAVGSLFQKLQPNPFGWFAEERVNLLAVIQQAHEAQLGSIAWELACSIRPFLNWLDLWTDWERTQTLALDAAIRADDLRGQAVTLRHLGHAYEEQDRWSEALECFNDSLSCHRKLGDPLGEGQALWSQGYVLRAQGYLREALTCFEQCLPIFEKLGVKQWQALALDGLALVYRDQGYFNDAVKSLRECLSLLQQLGDSYWHAKAGGHMGSLYLNMECFDEALDYLERSRAIFHDFGDRQHEAVIVRNIGRVNLAKGRVKEARKCFQDVLPIFEELGNQHQRAITIHNLGKVQLMRGDYDEAFALLQQCRPDFVEFKDRKWELENSLVLAELDLKRRRADEARGLLETSLRLARKMGSPLYEARVLRAMGAVLAHQGDSAASREAVQRGEAILRQLQLKPL
jgi:tetratricopeptide (TPR) repeat protein